MRVAAAHAIGAIAGCFNHSSVMELCNLPEAKMKECWVFYIHTGWNYEYELAFKGAPGSKMMKEYFIRKLDIVKASNEEESFAKKTFTKATNTSTSSDEDMLQEMENKRVMQVKKMAVPVIQIVWKDIVHDWMSINGKMTLKLQGTCMIWLGHIRDLEDDEEGLVDGIAIDRLPEPVNFSYARNVVHRDIGKVLSWIILEVLIDVACIASILVILVVPAEVPIAPTGLLVKPEVGAISVISPTRVLDLVDYSSSFDFDLSKDSLLVAPELPLVSPFLCSGDLKADNESEPAKQRPKRHESLAPSSKFPLALVVALPGIRRRPVILVRPGEKSVGPFPSRTTWHGDMLSSLFIRIVILPPVFTSDIICLLVILQNLNQIFLRLSSDSLSYSSKFILRMYDHKGILRFIFNLLLSIFSHEITRSPTTLVPSSTPISGSIAPALADLPPHLGISDGVGAHTEDGIGMGVEVATSDIREDEEEFEVEASAGGTMEITLDPLVTSGIFEPTGGDAPRILRVLFMTGEPKVQALLCIKRDYVDSLLRQMALSQEEFCQIRRDRDDTQRRIRRTMTNTRSGMTPAAIEEMINRRVTEALETREANRNIRLGNGNDEGGNGNDNGNGNRNGGGNRNGNHNENDRDARPVVRGCTYQDFMKCQPLNFKGTKGVDGLIRWFEKMETVFHISNFPEKYQVKYATCTLLNGALTW
ncbi:hypothetical protein Tco_0070681 [Tanacetum coccineum]